MCWSAALLLLTFLSYAYVTNLYHRQSHIRHKGALIMHVHARAGCPRVFQRLRSFVCKRSLNGSRRALPVVTWWLVLPCFGCI